MFLCLAISSAAMAPAPQYYQLKVYHFKTADQERMLDAYLKDAYLPALHRHKLSNVGVFKTLPQDTADRRIYVLTTFATPAKALTLDEEIFADARFREAAKAYISSPYQSPAYMRFETILLRSFNTWPVLTPPKLTAPKAERIYELRSYESATEAFYQNKVKMFNTGNETGLFARLKFNAVFYADVLAGSRMPNLMYMTTFENKADRDKHWDAFGNDAYWKDLSSRAEYQHNVSKADIIFLYPAEYSDL